MTALRVKDVQAAIATHYGISVEELTGPSRRVEAVCRRAVAYRLCLDFTSATRAEIGREFGDRDHATVVNGLTYFDAKATLAMRATYHKLAEDLKVSAPHVQELVWAFPFKSRRTTPVPAPQFIRERGQ